MSTLKMTGPARSNSSNPSLLVVSAESVKARKPHGAEDFNSLHQEGDPAAFIERPDFILEDVRIIKHSLSKLKEKRNGSKLLLNVGNIFSEHYTENLEASIALERALKALDVDRSEMEEKCDEAAVEVIMANFEYPIFAKGNLEAVIEYHKQDTKIQDDKLDNSFFRLCLYRLLNCTKSNLQCTKLMNASKRVTESAHYRAELIDVPSCWGSFDVLLDLFLHLMLPLIYHNPNLEVGELLKSIYAKKDTSQEDEAKTTGTAGATTSAGGRKRGRQTQQQQQAAAEKAKKAKFHALEYDQLREAEKEDLEEKRKKLVEMSIQAEYVYLLAQTVLVSLKKVLPKREVVIVALSKELELAALRRSPNALVYSVEFTENICDYPVPARAMKNIARFQCIQPEDIDILYNAYTSHNPPPSDLLLLPTIPELLVDAIFSPLDLEHVNPEEHRKLVYLYAYAASKRDIMRDGKRHDIENCGFQEVNEQLHSASDICRRWTKISSTAAVFNMRDYHDLPLLLKYLAACPAVAYGVLRFVCTTLGPLLGHRDASGGLEGHSTLALLMQERRVLLPDGLCTQWLEYGNSTSTANRYIVGPFSSPCHPLPGASDTLPATSILSESETDLEDNDVIAEFRLLMEGSSCSWAWPGWSAEDGVCGVPGGNGAGMGSAARNGGSEEDLPQQLQAQQRAYPLTDESFQPYKALLTDLITHWPYLRPFIRALIARLLSEKHLQGIQDLDLVSLQRSLVDLAIHLMLSGNALPVMNIMKKLYFHRHMDVSLARYFVTELLNMAQRPYKADFMEALNPFIQNQEIINGAKTNRVDFENIREFIENYQQLKKLRRATRK